MMPGKYPGWCLLALLFISLVGCTRSQKIVLIENGKSSYSIVIPDGGEGKDRVAEAATFFQQSLESATGVKLPVTRESQFKSGPAVYLGMTEAFKKTGLPPEKVRGWNCVNRVIGENIFLAGEDGEYIVADWKSFYNGTLKAVTLFLENELGARFLLPGPKGYYIPKHNRVSVSAGLNRSWQPAFEYVMGRFPGNRSYQVADNYLPSHIYYSHGGHAYYSAVPREKYAKSHPEYYIFRAASGVRDPFLGHLCISNPEVQELLIRRLSDILDSGADWVELGQTDAEVPCECEACRAIHPDQGERIWIVHRKIAETLKKSHPGKKVVILSYGSTTRPPKTFSDFPDNVMIQMCYYTPEAFAAWAPFRVDKTVYIYTFFKIHGFMPQRTPRYAAEQVRLFSDNNVRGIYLCGGFEMPGLEGPVYYVYGRMLGNPLLNWQEVADEFYALAYGKAREPMKRFFDAMHGSLEQYVSAYDYMGIYPLPPLPANKRMFSAINAGDAYRCYFPMELLLEMERNLERAKTMTTDPDELSRIRLVEYEFRYLKNIAEVFRLYYSYYQNPGWEAFEPLAGKIEECNRLLDEYFPDGPQGQAKAFDGWRRPFDGQKKSAVERKTGPFGWDIEQIRKSGVLPAKLNLNNPSFEMGWTGWQFPTGGTLRDDDPWRLDNENAVHGSHSLVIRGTQLPTRLRMSGITLEPGKEYILSAWFKTENLEPSEKTGIFIINTGWKSDFNSRLCPPSGTSGWQERSAIFKPDASEDGSYQILIDTPAKGKMWIDNIRLEEKNKAGQG
jgi:hypothetical protein